MLLGAKCIATRSNKLLGAPGIATRSKDAIRLDLQIATSLEAKCFALGSITAINLSMLSEPPFVLKPECPCIQAAYRCLVDVWVQRNLFEPDLALVQPGDQPVSIDSLGMVVG